MHLALKSAMSRIPYTNKVGETLGSIADPAAAYSLRALGGGDPMVARVRRSSDDAEKDFTASDMDSGSVADWVNGIPTLDVASNYTLSGQTYETFTNASNSGFTVTNGITGARAGFGGVTGTSGDVLSVSFDLNIVTGSPRMILSNYNTVNTRSNDIIYNASGYYTATLTANGTFNFITFTEGDIPAEWTISNFKITAISSQDGHVTTWYDQSGNDNHATQGTAGSQPKIVDAGVLVSDGIKFDGASTQLSTASPILTSDTFYCASVLKHSTGTSASGNEIIFGQYDASSSGRWFVFVNTSFQLRFGSNATDPIAGNFIDPLSASATLISATATNNLATLYSNGNSTTSDAYSGFSPALIPFTIGKPNSNNNSVNGTISEIIIYNSDQSSNREAIETNINNHYDIY